MIRADLSVGHCARRQEVGKVARKRLRCLAQVDAPNGPCLQYLSLRQAAVDAARRGRCDSLGAQRGRATGRTAV